MTALTRWTATLSFMLLGGLIAAGPAAAQNTRPVPLEGVKDGAELFSKKAVQKARQQIAEIKRSTHKDLVIETFTNPPDRYKGQAIKEFAPGWTKRNFDVLGVDGIYILLCRQPAWIDVQVGNVTMRQGEFTAAERRELFQIIEKNLQAAGAANKKGEKEAAAESRDKALLDAVAYVRDNMAPAPTRPVVAAPAPGRSFLSMYGGWICLGLVALLVVWLIFGVIRGLSNRGSPGYGSGGGGGGGYGGGGGGGGGFFTSMLGGMFGAAAGMWMYSHFFGGTTPSAGASGPMGGGADSNQSDVGQGSEGTGGDAGGGDWGGGGDAGGGDAGAGGDWGGGGGGGGDAGGGGGDWGGGGGDAGGGGGDWGGGGGGGGGGGDW